MSNNEKWNWQNMKWSQSNGIFQWRKKYVYTYNSMDRTVGCAQACGVCTWHCLWHFSRQSRHSYACFPGRRGIERLHTSHVSPLSIDNVKRINEKWLKIDFDFDAASDRIFTRSYASLRMCDRCKCAISFLCVAIVVVGRSKVALRNV